MAVPHAVCVVLTTVDSEAAAERLARNWVESRRAACVSIVPAVQSVYRWKGEVQSEREWLLLVKTAVADGVACAELLEGFAADHPYDEPELVVVEVAAGAEGYLGWVRGQVE